MLKSLDKMSHFWKQKRILHESLIYHLHVWLVVCPHACYIDKRPWWGVISLTNALLKFLQVVYFQRMFSCLWYIHWLISRKIDHGFWTRVAAVRSEWNGHYGTWTPYIVRYDTLFYCIVVLNKSRLYFDIWGH